MRETRGPCGLVGKCLSILSGNTSKSCRSPVVGEPRLHHELKSSHGGWEFGTSKGRTSEISLEGFLEERVVMV